MDRFHFKDFSLSHEKSTLKIGTDSVLLASVVPVNEATSILDVGCGCGVIAFCLANKLARERAGVTYHLTGIDIDEASVQEAMENLSYFPDNKEQSINFLKISLQEYALKNEKLHDLIVSNPPYFANSLKPTSSKKCQSKHRDQNLTFEKMIDDIFSLLSPEGRFYLILPPAENSLFEELASKKLYLFERWNIFPSRDKKINRVISGYAKQPDQPLSLKTITIRDSQNQYTQRYIDITRAFYIGLKMN